MPNSIQLHIPSPCQENWNAMSISEKGRFCNACHKQVIDFTAMSDAELYGYFLKPAGESVCGRFRKSQLAKPLTAERRPLPWARYVVQTSIPLFLLAGEGHGQSEVQPPSTTAMCYRLSDSELSLRKGNVLDKDSQLVAVTGRLIDEEGNAIANATLTDKMSGASTRSDLNGQFKLFLPDQQIAVIEGFSEEYDPLQIRCLINGAVDLGDRQMFFKTLGKVIMAGAITAVLDPEPVKKIDTIFQRLISNEPIKLYPNPIQKGQSLQIDLLRKAEGLKQVTVFNLAGQLQYELNTGPLKNGQQLRVALPPLNPGIYVVQLTYQDSSLTISDTLIVQ